MPSYQEIDATYGWARVYYTWGQNQSSPRVSQINTPPTSGHQHVIIADGVSSCMIFDLQTFQSFSVSHRSAEYASLTAPAQDFDAEQVVQHMLKAWWHAKKYNFQADWARASAIIKALGGTPPAIELSIAVDDFNNPIEPPANRKGKGIEEELKKPVKRKSKRGQLLEWFLSEDGSPKHITEAMERFKTNRNNILSYLFMLNKDHGIGYVLGSGTATVFVPGQVDPFLPED